MEFESIDYSHLYTDYYKDKVYLPSEDTFFFVDILHNDFKNITQKKPSLILELGSGSGYITTYLLKLFKSHQNVTHSESEVSIPFCVCVDINKYANESTNQMLQFNGLKSYCDSICMDMFYNINRVKFDMIIFNPPYVPGTTEDDSDVIDMAWNGGKDGSETIKRFIGNIDNYLDKDGCAYLLLEERNKVDEIVETIRKNNHGLEARSL
ncbi:peptide chain release factor N(5)-glutamine methyltransferase [Theileria orientalis]|uniref:Peptide chain release factor N(5)-glutamine methyltransferase n=1 Tax=Theileria orientalis TaxID=68886 RepID=A0A976SJV5_THEOR|nr:peptide chain release factor N(5)-glutamine methyltransferase [Theileria orientalis]